jgi:hypothetical protein
MNELPELATLPVLNETEAAILRRDLGTLPPDLQERARHRLRRYDNEQQSQIFAAFDDPSTVPDTGGWAAEAERERPGEGLKMRKKDAVANFYAREYGTTQHQVLQRFDDYNYDYGAKNFNEAVPLEPERMFERIKPVVQAKKDEEDALKSMPDTALEWFGTGGSASAGFAKWQASQPHAVAKSEKALKLWNAVAEHEKARAEALRPHQWLVKKALTGLRDEAGVEDGQVWFNEVKRDLLDLYKTDRKAYEAVRDEIAFRGTRGQDKEKGITQGVLENLWRGRLNLELPFVSARILETVGEEDNAKHVRASAAVDADIEDLITGAIDPVKSRRAGMAKALEDGLYTLAGSAPIMVAAGVAGPAGTAAKLTTAVVRTAPHFANDAYQQFRAAGLENADGLALVSGVAQAAIESASELAVKIPGVAGVLSKWGMKGGGVTQFLLRSVLRSGVETGEETAQQAMTPMLHEIAAATLDSVPDVPAKFTLREQMSEFFKSDNLAPLLVSVVPLGMLGAGLSTRQDMAFVDSILKNETAVRAVFEKEKAAVILAESDPRKKAELAKQNWPHDATPEELAQRAQAAVDEQNATTKLVLNVMRGQAVEAAQAGIKITHAKGEWTVTHDDGTTIKVDSAEAAERIRGDLLLAATEQEAEALVAQVETWASERPDIRREATLTGDMVERKDGKLQATDARGTVREVSNASMLASVRAQTVGMEQREVDVVINGSNAAFAESVGEAAVGLVQTITVNRGRNQAAGITFLHEKLEANLKAAGLSKLVSAKEVQTALSVVANALPIEPVRARLEALRKRGAHADHIAEAEGELALRERLHKVAAGKGSEAEMREVAVELAVAEVLGRGKRDGRTGLAPGALNKMLGEAAMQATPAAEVQALGKFRAFLRSVRAWLRGVLGTVAGLEKARRDGKLKDGDDFGALVDTMLGLEGSKFSKAVEVEAGAMLGETHSLTPSRREGSLKGEDATTTNEDASPSDEQRSFLVTDAGRGDRFHHSISEAAKSHKFGFAVQIKERDFYNDPANKLYLGLNDQAGAVVTAEADLVSVFKHPAAKGSIAPLLEEASRDALTLDGFDVGGKLPDLYAVYGFRPAARVAFNKEYAPDGWDYTIAGEPDVVLMVRDTEGVSGLSEVPIYSDGGYAAIRDEIPLVGYEEAVNLQQAAVARVKAASQTHSLSPARRMELVENRLAVVLNQDSEQARKFAERANERLGRLKSRYAGVPAPKSKVELDKQQAGMVEARRSELEDILTGEVEARMGGVHALVTKLREHPLGDALLRSDMRRKRLYLGSLMAPSKWRAEQLARSGTITGDYDGADGLPAMFFRGNGKPDEVAKELHGQGIIKGDTADDLWTAMGAMMNELATNKEQMQKYREQLREARQAAKEEAEYEGRAWRAEEDEKQVFLGNPRDAAMRDVAALDAVTMAMPPEARAKLPRGLNATIAGAKSDKAFADAMTKAVRAVDAALNDYWKAKNIESMNKLVLLGQGKTAPGKKPKGTATPEVHSYFDYAAKVAVMTPEEAGAERLKVDKLIADNAGKADESLWIERGQILDTWGAFASLHVSAQAQALEDGWELYRIGRNAWRASEDGRLAEQRAEAAEFIAQIGQGTYERIARAAGDATGEGGRVRRAKALKTWAGKFDVETRDFEGVLSALLGRDHPITQRWAKQVREGLAKKDDAMRALRKRWQSALDLAMPGMGHSRQRKRLWEMRTVRNLEVDIVEEESRADLTAEERDELREAGGLGAVQSKVKMTEDEAIFITMTARQKQYVEPLAMAGYTPAVIASLEARITPEGKALREFMAAEYDAGHAGLNDVMQRVQGIKLPKIPNYSPGRFYNWGNEKPLDVMGTGVVNAGFASGFLIDRRAHFSQVKLASALGVFWTHQNESLHWQALAEPVRAMRGVLRNPDVKRALDGAWGAEGNALLEQWMQALEGNGIKKAGGAWDKLINAASGNFALAKLGYNVGTIAKQSLAILNTALDVPFGMWVMGAGEVMQNPGRFREVFDSDFIQRRMENGFSPEVRTVLDRFWSAEPGVAQEVMEKGMEFLGFADAFFTSVSAAVAYEAHARMAEKAGMSPDQAHLIGMEKAAEAVSKTAQPQTVATRSMFELNLSPVGRLSFMFMTEARQKASLWLEAQGRFWTGEASPRDKQVLAVTHLLLAPMLQAITSAIKDWRDGPDDGDDDPAWEATDFLVAALLGPIDGIPFVGSAIKDGIAGRAWGGKGSDVLGSPITGALTVGADLFTDLFDEKDQTLGETVDKILRLASQIGGPAGVGANIYKQGQDTIESFQ